MAGAGINLCLFCPICSGVGEGETEIGVTGGSWGGGHLYLEASPDWPTIRDIATCVSWKPSGQTLCLLCPYHRGFCDRVSTKPQALRPELAVWLGCPWASLGPGFPISAVENWPSAQPPLSGSSSSHRGRLKITTSSCLSLSLSAATPGSASPTPQPLALTHFCFIRFWP